MASTQSYRVYRAVAGDVKRRPLSRLKSAPPPPQARSYGPVPHVVVRLPATNVKPIEDFRFPDAKAQGKGWTIWRITRWAGGMLALVVFGYIAWLGYSIYKFQEGVYVPLPPTRTPALLVEATAPPGVVVAEASPTIDHIKDLPAGRINILVLGTDKRADDPDHFPRSDTLILANVDTISHTVHVMSIPRDLIADIPGYGKNKINAAYLFGEYYKEPGGGQALALQTVSDYFGVPIDYYVTVNFEGFRKLVDTVGGVTVDVPYELDDYNYPSDDEGDNFGMLHVHFDAGVQRMDGKTALRYARTRHADNDFMRSKRQLQIITALRREAMSLDLVPILPTLIDQLAGMVETNIPFDQQLAFAQLGSQIAPTDIITSSIDSEMIVPATLPDGSEGLKLDWEVAQPMLDEHFGIDADSASPLSSPTGRARSTPAAPAPSRSAPVRGDATTKPVRSPSPQPKGTVTPIPTPVEGR
jgi:LCP family protein required for cell wall assembly